MLPVREEAIENRRSNSLQRFEGMCLLTGRTPQDAHFERMKLANDYWANESSAVKILEIGEAKR